MVPLQVERWAVQSAAGAVALRESTRAPGCPVRAASYLARWGTAQCYLRGKARRRARLLSLARRVRHDRCERWPGRCPPEGEENAACYPRVVCLPGRSVEE